MTFRALLARAFSPCPLWHRSKERFRRHENQRVIYECPLCLREASEALVSQPRSEPAAGPVITRRPLTQVEKVTQFPNRQAS